MKKILFRKKINKSIDKKKRKLNIIKKKKRIEEKRERGILSLSLMSPLLHDEERRGMIERHSSLSCHLLSRSSLLAHKGKEREILPFASFHLSSPVAY